MSDINKNMDNEQTVYVAENEFGAAPPNPVTPNAANVFQSQGMPPGGNPGLNRTSQNMYEAQSGRPPQSPPNAYRAQPGIPPQMPPNAYGAQPGIPPQMPPNAYGAQPGISPQVPSNAYGAPPGMPLQMPPDMYGIPVGYNDPRMRQAAPPEYNEGKKKGSAAVVVLVVMIVLTLCAIAGIAAFIFLRDSDDDDDTKGKRNHDMSSESLMAEDDEDDDERSPSDIGESQVDVEQPATAAPDTVPEPKLVSTPNVKGMDVNEASYSLKEIGFVVEIENKYSSVPENTVISQDVAAGTNVAEGTRIVIVVSQGPETSQEITAPDIRGKTFEEARDELSKCGLSVTCVYEESDSVAEGKVIDQNIAPGTKVKKGSGITLTVSNGSRISDSQHRQGRVVTKETDLNVRKGPGKEFDVAGAVAKDGIVEIVSDEGDWYKIVYKNGYGYVSKDYIQLIN